MSPLGWFGLAALVGAGVGWVAARGTPWVLRLVALVGGSSAAALSVALFVPRVGDVDLETRTPELAPRDGFVSSDTCRACHPGQYQTWHDSFHRTMTQVATPEAVVAAFDGRTLEGYGLAARVWREGDRFLAELGPAEAAEDASADASVPLEPRRVVLTTGSHHMQAFWLTAEDGTLEQLPFVWLIEEARWIANDDSFLQPPGDEPAEAAVWSDGCVLCHSTGGPWTPTDRGTHGEAAVVELGIACERCHGPAEEHVRANTSPARRYALHLGSEGDSTIVNPRRLDHVRSTALCGTCHTACEDLVDSAGEFLPGELLSDHLDFAAMHGAAAEASEVVDPDELDDDIRDVVEAFWRDGRARVAGREYDAVTQSPCYLQGEMSCTSCHRVHGHEPDGQVEPVTDGSGLCGSCHQAIVADVGAHTHHPVQSEGSDCLSCHMPYTSYGLLSATRSHRLASPRATGLEGRETPNACNLCHLDRSVGWTARRLQEWYGTEVPALAADRSELPAGAVWMLRGDPVQRALAAWHYGWAPAREASDLRPLRPALGVLLADPYSAVRQIAGRVAVEHEGLVIDMDALSDAPQEALMRQLRQATPELTIDTMRALLHDRIDAAASIPE